MFIDCETPVPIDWETPIGVIIFHWLLGVIIFHLVASWVFAVSRCLVGMGGHQLFTGCRWCVTETLDTTLVK